MTDIYGGVEKTEVPIGKLEELFNSEARYRRLFEAARDGILILDAVTGKITDVNPFMVELLGYAREEFLGKELFEIGLLKDAGASAEAFQELQKNGYIRYEDLPLQTKAGKRRDVEFVSNIYEENGRQVIQCNIRDITVRKQAEETLRQSEANLRAAQQIAHMGSWELDLENLEDLDRNPLRWSDEIFRIFGYQPGQLEVSNENFFQAVHPEDRDSIRAAMSMALKGGQPYNIDHRIILPDGTERIVHEQADFIRDQSSGAPLKMIGTVQDVTERKLIEEGFARLASIVECSDDAIISKTLDGIITTWNTGAQTLYGYTKEEAVGRSVSMLAPPELSDEMPHLLGKIRRGERVDHYETERVRKDGSHVDISLSISPLKDAAGHIIGVSSIKRDITQRKAAQQQLRLHSHLLSAIGQAAIVTDLAGIITYWNESAEKLYGWSAFEALGQNFLSIVPTDTTQEQAAEIRVSLKRGERWSGEFLARRRDGTTFPAYVTNTPVMDVAGQITSIFGLSFDISDSKQAEIKLKNERDFIAAVIDTVGNLVVVLDRQARIVRFNHACEQLTGYAFDEVQGQSAHTLFLAPEELEGVKVAFNKLSSGQFPNTYENDWITRDGSRRLIAWSSTALLDSAGAVEFIIGTGTDITERRLGEAALRESETRYRALAEAAPDDIFIVNRDCVLQYINHHAAQKFGLPPEALVGKSQLELFPPQVAETNLHDFNQVLQNGEPLYQESRLTFQGRNTWIGTWMVPLKNAAGEICQVMGVGRDMSGQKQAEATLRASEARYRSLFQSNPQPMWVFDLETLGFLAVNDAAVRHYGYSTDEFLAMTIKELRPLEDLSALMAFIAQPSSHGGRHGFLRHRKNDGTVIEVEISAHELSFRERRACLVLAQDITERQQAETQRDRFFTMAVDILATFGLDGQFKRMNPAFTETLGFTEDEIISKPFMDWVHPEDRAATLAVVETLAEGRPILEFENRYRTTSGSYRWLEWRAVPVLEEGLIYAAARDVTDRKQVEQSLQKAYDEMESRVMQRTAELGAANEQLNAELSERNRTEAALLEAQQMLELVMNHIPQAIFWKDRSSKFLGCNYRFASDAGYHSSTEIRGKTDFDMPSAEYAARYRADDKYVMETDRPKLNIEESLLKADGTPLWLHTNKIPLHDSHNNVVGVLCSYEDITERKQSEEATHQARREAEAANEELRTEIVERQRAEAEVQRSQQELQSFIDAMSTLAAKVAPDGTFLIANKIAFDASGISREEYMQTNFLEGPWWTFDSKVQARVREVFRQAVSGIAINYDENIFVFGREKTINFSLIPIRDAVGTVEYLIAEGRDITQLKQTEEALQQAKAEAERANRAKSEFLSRMSHELRTPLNAILGFGQLLANQNFAPAQQVRVQHILKAGRHLLNLINEVLEISRIEAGHMLLSLEPVHVREMVEEVFALVRPLAEEHSIQLSGSDSPELEVHVLADLQRLKQVLLNLCSNAVKYNRPHGTITVTCQRITGIPSSQTPAPGDRLRINVMDTGPGLAESALQQLFVPFMRLGAELTTIEGTGLGLALSLSLMHAMDGTIGVESEVGVGSTFWVQLPLVPAPILPDALAQEIKPPDLTQVPAGANLYTLLYIEDNLSNLQLVEDIISDQPIYKLLTALQGQIGLDLARQHHPDLIILDLHLPDVPGDQVLARLKAEPDTADIPVVMLSAVAMESEINRLMAGGAIAYLTKPLNVYKFLSTIVDILQTPHRSV